MVIECTVTFGRLSEVVLIPLVEYVTSAALDFIGIYRLHRVTYWL